MANLFPISSVYGEALAALQQKLQQALMDADYEEQSKRRLLDQQLFTLGQNRERGLMENNVNLADRGLGRSGIALKSEADLRTNYDNQQSGYNQEFNSALAQLARKRLDANENFALGAGGLMRQSAAGMNPLTYTRPPAKPPVNGGNTQSLPPAPVLQTGRTDLMRLKRPTSTQNVLS